MKNTNSIFVVLLSEIKTEIHVLGILATMEQHVLTLEIMSLNASVLRAILEHVADKVTSVFFLCFNIALIDAVAWPVDSTLHSQYLSPSSCINVTDQLLELPFKRY